MKRGSLRQGIVKLRPALRFAVGTVKYTVCSFSSNRTCTNPLSTGEFVDSTWFPTRIDSCTVLGAGCKHV